MPRVPRSTPHVVRSHRTNTPSGQLPQFAWTGCARRTRHHPVARKWPRPSGDLPPQRQRIPRGNARCVQGARRSVQCELSLRGRRTHIPAHRLVRHRDRVPLLVRADAAVGTWRSSETARLHPGTRRVEPTSSRRCGVVRGCAGPVECGGSTPRISRRPLHLVHRRHHGHAEGSDVASGRCTGRVLRREQDRRDRRRVHQRAHRAPFTHRSPVHARRRSLGELQHLERWRNRFRSVDSRTPRSGRHVVDGRTRTHRLHVDRR